EEAVGGQSVCPSWSLSSSGLPCPIRRRLSDPAHKNQSSVVQAFVRVFFPRLDVKGIVVTGAQFLIKKHTDCPLLDQLLHLRPLEDIIEMRLGAELAVLVSQLACPVQDGFPF